MKFESEKGLFNGLVYFGITALLFAIFLSKVFFSSIGFEPKDLIVLAPIVLLTWSWFNTSYKIENGFVKFKNGFFFGKIAIVNIRKIEKNKTLWVGRKPALATNGVIVSFGKFSEIYFSPIDKEKFVGLLQEINPSIEVKDANTNS